MMEQLWRRTEEEAELLGRTYGTRYHPEAVQTLIKRVEERREALSEDEGNHPLHLHRRGHDNGRRFPDPNSKNKRKRSSDR